MTTLNIIYYDLKTLFPCDVLSKKRNKSSAHSTFLTFGTNIQ